MYVLRLLQSQEVVLLEGRSVEMTYDQGMAVYLEPGGYH